MDWNVYHLDLVAMAIDHSSFPELTKNKEISKTKLLLEKIKNNVTEHNILVL